MIALICLFVGLMTGGQGWLIAAAIFGGIELISMVAILIGNAVG